MSPPLQRPRANTRAKLRQGRLATCLIATLGLGSTAGPLSAATIWPVGRCSDTAGKGGDTLRIAINKAASGDIIDMTTLASTCTTITLAFEVPILVNYLTINGPTDHLVTVSGNNVGRVFNHSGSGKLTLNNLGLASGTTGGNGGCVASSGSVQLQSTIVSGCTSGAHGGAVYTASNTILVGSTLTHNHATQAYVGDGGAIWASANVFASGANEISDNHAFYTAGVVALGAITLATTTVSGNLGTISCGAAYAGGYFGLTSSRVTGNSGGICADDAHLTATTIANNYTSGPLFSGGTGLYTRSATVTGSTFYGQAAGIDLYSSNGNPAGSLTMRNSTISSHAGPGIVAHNTVLDVENSTIAFNGGHGIEASLCNIDVVSSIVADNGISDVYATTCNPSGGHNLIRSSNVPFALSITADPQLTPLGNHGGPVMTHSLAASSPAIDTGSNPLNLPSDARGDGYPRVAGAAADIGAYERQANDDELFYNGFD